MTRNQLRNELEGLKETKSDFFRNREAKNVEHGLMKRFIESMVDADPMSAETKYQMAAELFDVLDTNYHEVKMNTETK